MIIRGQKAFVTDAGRKLYAPHENNDCTVRAYALVTKRSYPVAHDILALLGRMPKHGIIFKFAAPYLRDELETVLDEDRGYVRETTQSFLRKFKRGRYLVIVHGHIFAVINGVVWDSYEDIEMDFINNRIKQVWRVK